MLGCVCMRKKKFWTKVVAPAILSIAVVPLDASVLPAQERPILLFDTQCVENGPGRARLDTLDVAVGRQVYTSFLSMGPGNRYASVTCRISSDDTGDYEYTQEFEDITVAFRSLVLGFGMRDNQWVSPPTIVNIYLDGNLAVSRTISPGEKAFLDPINVSQVRNISIETSCTSQVNYCDRVYFFEASLQPQQIVPQSTQTETPTSDQIPTVPAREVQTSPPPPPPAGSSSSSPLPEVEVRQ